MFMHASSNVVPNLLSSNPLCLFLLSLVWFFDERGHAGAKDGFWMQKEARKESPKIIKAHEIVHFLCLMRHMRMRLGTKAPRIASWDPFKILQDIDLAHSLHTLLATSFRNFHLWPPPNWNRIINCTFFVCSKQLQPSLLASFCNFIFTDSLVQRFVDRLVCSTVNITVQLVTLPAPWQVPVAAKLQQIRWFPELVCGVSEATCRWRAKTPTTRQATTKQNTQNQNTVIIQRIRSLSRDSNPKSHQARDFGKKTMTNMICFKIMVPSIYVIKCTTTTANWIQRSKCDLKLYSMFQFTVQLLKLLFWFATKRLENEMHILVFTSCATWMKMPRQYWNIRKTCVFHCCGIDGIVSIVSDWKKWFSQTLSSSTTVDRVESIPSTLMQARCRHNAGTVQTNGLRQMLRMSETQRQYHIGKWYQVVAHETFVTTTVCAETEDKMDSCQPLFGMLYSL